MSEGKGLFFIFITALLAMIAGLYWFRGREEDGEPNILDWTPPGPKELVDKMREDQERNGIYQQPPPPPSDTYPAAAPADTTTPAYTPPEPEPVYTPPTGGGGVIEPIYTPTPTPTPTPPKPPPPTEIRPDQWWLTPPPEPAPPIGPGAGWGGGGSGVRNGEPAPAPTYPPPSPVDSAPFILNPAME